MFFYYARLDYNVNNKRCVYPEIEHVYAFFLGLPGGCFEHGGFREKYSFPMTSQTTPSTSTFGMS